RQFAHLPAVDHRAENTVNTLAAISDELGRAKPTGRNAAQLGPKPLPVFPGTEWFALRAEQEHGDLAASAFGRNNQRRALLRKQDLPIANLAGRHGKLDLLEFGIQGQPIRGITDARDGLAPVWPGRSRRLVA